MLSFMASTWFLESRKILSSKYMIGEKQVGQFRMITEAFVLRKMSATWLQCGHLTVNVLTIFSPPAFRKRTLFSGTLTAGFSDSSVSCINSILIVSLNGSTVKEDIAG